MSRQDSTATEPPLTGQSQTRAAPKSEPLILTFPAPDGLLAAAMLLRARPRAELRLCSESRLPESLEAQLSEDARPIIIAGVGLRGDPKRSVEAARALRERGYELTVYLRQSFSAALPPGLEEACLLVMAPAETFTGLVQQHLQDQSSAATRLTQAALSAELAEPPGAEAPPSPLVQKLASLAQGAVVDYFKFHDTEVFERVARHLASGQLDADDERLIARFDRHGNRYVLQGRSEALRLIRERVRRCAQSELPVLISGETGTGKEIIARLLHERSRRCFEPFIAVNCANFAGSVELSNSDLFGHVEGAFTGARGERRGAFRAADRGTLFLDEVAELPLLVQAKLLRVLENESIQALGADVESRIDVRLIVASHSNLRQAVRAGRFREDLLHRIDTLSIDIPPLRERPEDVASLARHVLHRMKAAGSALELDEDALESLREYPWPGNARQLIKILERARALEISVQEALAEEAWEAPQESELRFPASREALLSVEELVQSYCLHVQKLFKTKKEAAQAVGLGADTYAKKLNEARRPGR